MKTKTWIFKLVLDPGHGGCFRGRIAICFDFICTVYLMAKCIFPKPLLKPAMMRCLQKIRVKVNIFEKVTKIFRLLFELTNKQTIAAFSEYMDFNCDFYSYRKFLKSRKLWCIFNITFHLINFYWLNALRANGGFMKAF